MTEHQSLQTRNPFKVALIQMDVARGEKLRNFACRLADQGSGGERCRPGDLARSHEPGLDAPIL